jgi:hypothetical protein
MVASFDSLFIHERFDANTAGLAAEVPTKCVSTCKSPAAAPAVGVLELALANELLFTRVQAFMTLAIVLTSKCFATNTADKGALICMGTKM